MIDNNLLRSVTDAAVELCCGDAMLKDRLQSAVHALDVVLVVREDWPVMLRQRAQEIADELKTRGHSEKTIAAMDSQAARRLAERILHLYADCRTAAAGG
jgi:hypothetical protein